MAKKSVKSDMTTTLAVLEKIKKTKGKTPPAQILTAQHLRELKNTCRNPMQQFKRYRG